MHRPTTFGVDHAAAIIREIIDVPAEDGLRFDRASVTAEPIREADEYRGVRVHLSATLHTARIRMQIDIGVGDASTPPARETTLPTILDDFSAPRVKVYPAKTIVAEKLHAMVKLGIANSRMKDFFDVHVLASMREFDGALHSKAVTRTFKRRRTAIPDELFALSDEFYADRQKQSQWRAFLRKTGAAAPDDFLAVGTFLREFLLPVMKSARDDTTAPMVCGGQAPGRNAVSDARLPCGKSRFTENTPEPTYYPLNSSFSICNQAHVDLTPR